MANQTYINAWADYRRRRIFYYTAFLGGFVLAILPIYALAFVGTPQWIFKVIGAVWIVTFFVAAFRLQAFQCPRCHNGFFKTFWYYNPFAAMCVHCALPKGQQ